MMFIFLSVASAALFSFIAVAAWSDARRREREAYYKSETLKRIIEKEGPAANAALELFREEERNAARRQLEGIKLGGLVTAAAGIGLFPLLRGVVPAEPVYLAGLIPLLIGVALLAYAYILAPKV
jgi:ferric-dicitrate binding protein FerR (iron transport regulator)